METVDAGFAVPIPTFLNTLNPQLLSQGAEALTLLVDSPIETGKKCVAKYRPPKSYRIAELDKSLRKKRTTAETKVLEKLKDAGVNCPALIKQDLRNGLIYMDYIDGCTLKVKTWETTNISELEPLFNEFGQLVANMHQVNVTHGDLTTSNVLVSGNTLYTIDFGLSNMSANIEDKAVDIYVLERAIESTHAKVAAELTKQVLQGYQQAFKDTNQYQQIITRLETVRQRGRKRSMLG